MFFRRESDTSVLIRTREGKHGFGYCSNAIARDSLMNPELDCLPINLASDPKRERTPGICITQNAKRNIQGEKFRRYAAAAPSVPRTALFSGLAIIKRVSKRENYSHNNFIASASTKLDVDIDISRICHHFPEQRAREFPRCSAEMCKL